MSPDTERTHSEIMVIISALMLAMLLAALDQTIVATALPRIASDLHGLNKLSWVVTAYLLTSAVSTPLYGKISDMFGRKKIFQFSIGLFLVGSALCGLSQNMNQLIAFRALQGLGAGGLFTLSLAVIGDVIPPRQRGRYQGYFGAVFGIASIVGPLLGGFFTDSHTLGWRWIFYINLPLGVLALFAIATRLHLPIHRTKHRVDFLGAGLLGAAIASLLLVTVWGGATYPWGSATIIGLAITSLVTALLFIYRETRAAEPILPLRLFKNDIFTVATLMSLLAGFALFGAIIFLPEYQQVVLNYSATKSGLMLLPLIAGLLVAILFSGHFITKFGRYKIYPVVGSLLATLGYWLFSHISLTTSQVSLSLWMVVLGLGIGPFMQVTTLAVQNAVDRKD
ncbi:MAG: MDR family MFS transporter, partial [Candidatus Saccharimonadales bacterium]